MINSKQYTFHFQANPFFLVAIVVYSYVPTYAALQAHDYDSDGVSWSRISGFKGYSV